jgi:membrane-associated protein
MRFQKQYKMFFFILPTSLREVMVFIFAYLEGLPIIGSILPGGTIALLVGSLTTEGYMNAPLAAGIIAIGSFLGDATGFFVGRKIKGTKLFRKLVMQERHQKSWEVFDRHLAIILVFGKLVPVVRSTPSFFAGARTIPFSRYALWSAMGSSLWALMGIYGGKLLSRVLGPNAIPLIIGILIISAVFALIKSRSKKRKNIE